MDGNEAAPTGPIYVTKFLFEQVGSQLLLAIIGECENMTIASVDAVFKLLNTHRGRIAILRQDESWENYFSGADTIIDYILFITGRQLRRGEAERRRLEFDELLPEAIRLYIQACLGEKGHRLRNLAIEDPRPAVEVYTAMLVVVLKRLIPPEQRDLRRIFDVLSVHVQQHAPQNLTAFTEHVRACTDPFDLITETIAFCAKNKIPFKPIDVLTIGGIIPSES